MRDREDMNLVRLCLTDPGTMSLITVDIEMNSRLIFVEKHNRNSSEVSCFLY